jgi:hypothetical protein
MEGSDLDIAYRRFSELADRVKSILDQDLLALFPARQHESPAPKAF